MISRHQYLLFTSPTFLAQPDIPYPTLLQWSHGQHTSLHSFSQEGLSLHPSCERSSCFQIKNPTKVVRGRSYSASASPQSIQILTRTSPNTNSYYPLVEGHLEYAKLQPYVHDCTVTVLDGPRTTRFTIFFKRHIRLPINDFLSVNDNPIIRGDVVVMRRGTYIPYVDFRGGDRFLADWVVHR